ncbi:MAG: insulinase family protein [Firmicutes bacterium]|nr:insulinase family protein [Bacillota bacterium]
MEKVIHYSNGLKLIVENIPSLRSLSCGIWAGVGSAKENERTNGLSHFTEHMVFKGTDKLSAFEIADAFEKAGAAINAFTSKECTCYYFKSIDEYAEKCFSLLSHIFFDSVFQDVELDKERNVILEEINMTQDEPEDICYDLLANAVYGEHALGQTILGTKENVKRFDQKEVKEFISNFYCPQNMVISFAGNITLADADKLVKKYILTKTQHCGISQPLMTAHKITSCHKEHYKDFEQANIALSFPSFEFNSKYSVSAGLLSAVFGGSMSSRLFQQIREQMGLAYSVYSAPSTYQKNGTFNIVLNISPQNTEKAVSATMCEIKKLCEKGIKKDELERAKTGLKTALIFGQENVQTIMSTNGKLLMLANEVYDINKKIEEINKVTKKDIDEVIEKIFNSNIICSAYVGKDPKVKIESLF